MSHPRDLVYPPRAAPYTKSQAPVFYLPPYLLCHHSGKGEAPGVPLEDCGGDPGGTGEPPRGPRPELYLLVSLEQQTQGVILHTKVIKVAQGIFYLQGIKHDFITLNLNNIGVIFL